MHCFSPTSMERASRHLHLHLSLIALLLCSTAYAAPAPPRFSWDTVPVFYHSCNFSGPYSADALRVVAKFPMVTIEKGQGVTLPGFAEDKILATLQQVKALDPNISTIAYLNSGLDWPFYRMHEEFLQHPQWWLKDPHGRVCRLSGDPSFPNHTNLLTFDYVQPAVRDFWASECLNFTKTGAVDGCFCDRSVGPPPCGAGEAYTTGHIEMQQQLQRALGNGVLIANHGYNITGVSATQIESFKADEQSILTLQECVKNGKLTQAHAGYGEDGTADDHCSKGIVNSLAAFLIGAGYRSYYACSRGWKVQEDPVQDAWHPEFDKPLGQPVADGVKGADGIWRRNFTSARGVTSVSFDPKSNVGHIAWAGEGVRGDTAAGRGGRPLDVPMGEGNMVRLP